MKSFLLSAIFLLNLAFPMQQAHACGGNPDAHGGFTIGVTLAMPLIVVYSVGKSIGGNIIYTHSEWKEPWAEHSYKDKLNHFFADTNREIRTPTHVLNPFGYMVQLHRRRDRKIVTDIFYRLIKQHHMEAFLSLDRSSVPNLSLEYRKMLEGVNFLFHMEKNHYTYKFGQKLHWEDLDRLNKSYQYKFLSEEERTALKARAATLAPQE